MHLVALRWSDNIPPTLLQGFHRFQLNEGLRVPERARGSEGWLLRQLYRKSALQSSLCLRQEAPRPEGAIAAHLLEVFIYVPKDKIPLHGRLGD